MNRKLLCCLLTACLVAILPLAALAEDFDKSVRAAVEGSAVAGEAFLVSRAGERTEEIYAGLADRETGQKISADSVFEWGSATKLLTWVSVMQLVERGEISLEADIREYLPEGFFKKLSYPDKITLLNLMNHNAGWADRVVDLFSLSDNLPSLQDALKDFEPAQICAPSGVTAYSNYGAALAGYIVERVSGQPFSEYVHANIFDKLGMKHSALRPAREDNEWVRGARAAIKGYQEDGKGGLAASPTEGARIALYPAGAATGTAEDALAFLEALLPPAGESGPLFEKRETLDALLSASYRAAEDFPGVAHGLFEYFGTQRCLFHDGATDSFTALFILCPETSTAMVSLSNSAYSGLHWELAESLFGARVYPQAEPDTLIKTEELSGAYLPARRVYAGFTKLYDYLHIQPVFAEGETDLSVNGQLYGQVAPGIFQNGWRLITYDEAAHALAGGFYTLLPLSFGEYCNVHLAIAFAVAAAVFFVIAVITALGLCVRNAVRGSAASRSGKILFFLNLLGLSALLNNFLLFLRAMNYAALSALKPQLYLNIAYLLAAAALLAALFLVRKERRRLLSRIPVWASCLSTLMTFYLIIGLELYH